MPPAGQRAGDIVLIDSTHFTTLFGGTDSLKSLLAQPGHHEVRPHGRSWRMPNRAVFITGAAAGIGRATALTFAKNGYTVGGYDIDEVGLKSLADEIDDLGGTAIAGHLDVTDAAEMAQRVGEFAKSAAADST